MVKSIEDIEVKEAITVNETINNMEQEITMDITKMSPEQIKAFLQEKEKQEKAEKEKQYNHFIEEKENFIETAIRSFKTNHNELKELKEFSISRATELYNLMWELKGKAPKDVKKFQLVDKANKYKIVLERSERFKFNEEATVHIHGIKEIFKNKFESRNKGFYAVLDGILMKNSKGEYDAKLLAKARQQIKKLDDPELTREFDALEQCQIVDATSIYIRAYAKNELGKWEDINVQFSSL